MTQIYWPGEAGQRYRLQAFSTPDGAQPALDTVLGGWPAPAPGTFAFKCKTRPGLNSIFSPSRSVQIRPLVRDGSRNAISTGTGLGLEHPAY
jgi:hypothetical protein